MIRIGLLGASRIAVPAVIAPAKENKDATVTAVAARNVERAADYAVEHGIPAVLPDYRTLVESPDVDLVYNGLPPAAHAEWTIAALDAGKHVLCEKPFAMTSAEAEAMVSAASRNERVLLEAFHYRFHPLMDRVLAILASAEIGVVESAVGHFGVPIKFSDSEIRYRPELGGGALMDLGCYPLHWVRTLIPGEPVVASATRRLHASGVDIETEALLEFAGGETARISCAMDEDTVERFEARLSIIGSEGRIEIENPLSPHNGNRVTVTNNNGIHFEEVEGKSTYWHQLKHVLGLIDGTAKIILDADDAINNMRAIEAIFSASPVDQ